MLNRVPIISSFEAPVHVSLDKNADQKSLRKLEMKGWIVLHGAPLEGNEKSKIKPANFTPLVFGFDDSNARNHLHGGFQKDFRVEWETPETARVRSVIQRIVTADKFDPMHLERHVWSGHALFITDDNTDILSRRQQLFDALRIEIYSTLELIAAFTTRDRHTHL